MSREEKRRKFNEAVLNTLYPPPPNPNEKDLEENNYNAGFDSDPIPDDFEGSGSSTSSDDDDGETRSLKLTRAQRKRLRRKKLKSDRRKIIGPLLPPTESECEEEEEVDPQTVRPNASEQTPAITDDPGETELPSEEPGSSVGTSKVNRRRKAKKLTKESLLASSCENSYEYH